MAGYYYYYCYYWYYYCYYYYYYSVITIKVIIIVIILILILIYIYTYMILYDLFLGIVKGLPHFSMMVNLWLFQGSSPQIWCITWTLGFVKVGNVNANLMSTQSGDEQLHIVGSSKQQGFSGKNHDYIKPGWTTPQFTSRGGYLSSSGWDCSGFWSVIEHGGLGIDFAAKYFFPDVPVFFAASDSGWSDMTVVFLEMFWTWAKLRITCTSTSRNLDIVVIVPNFLIPAIPLTKVVWRFPVPLGTGQQDAQNQWKPDKNWQFNKFKGFLVLWVERETQKHPQPLECTNSQAYLEAGKNDQQSKALMGAVARSIHETPRFYSLSYCVIKHGRLGNPRPNWRFQWNDQNFGEGIFGS